MILSIYGYLRKMFWAAVSHRHEPVAGITKFDTPMICCAKCGKLLEFRHEPARF